MIWSLFLFPFQKLCFFLSPRVTRFPERNMALMPLRIRPNFVHERICLPPPKEDFFRKKYCIRCLGEPSNCPGMAAHANAICPSDVQVSRKKSWKLTGNWRFVEGNVGSFLGTLWVLKCKKWRKTFWCLSLRSFYAFTSALWLASCKCYMTTPGQLLFSNVAIRFIFSGF